MKTIYQLLIGCAAAVASILPAQAQENKDYELKGDGRFRSQIYRERFNDQPNLETMEGRIRLNATGNLKPFSAEVRGGIELSSKPIV